MLQHLVAVKQKVNLSVRNFSPGHRRRPEHTPTLSESAPAAPAGAEGLYTTISLALA
jgi:hypothetical protein